MKLSEYAKLQNVSYMTAHKWATNGQIPNCRKVGKRYVIEVETTKNDNDVINRLDEMTVMLKDIKNALNLEKK